MCLFKNFLNSHLQTFKMKEFARPAANDFYDQSQSLTVLHILLNIINHTCMTSTSAVLLFLVINYWVICALYSTDHAFPLFFSISISTSQNCQCEHLFLIHALNAKPVYHSMLQYSFEKKIFLQTTVFRI